MKKISQETHTGCSMMDNTEPSCTPGKELSFCMSFTFIKTLRCEHTDKQNCQKVCGSVGWLVGVDLWFGGLVFSGLFCLVLVLGCFFFLGNNLQHESYLKTKKVQSSSGAV